MSHKPAALSYVGPSSVHAGTDTITTTYDTTSAPGAPRDRLQDERRGRILTQPRVLATNWESWRESSEMIGRRIAHFRILAEIGQGGMGVVYKARDENLLRVVALKVLRPHQVSDKNKRQRLIHEARAAAAVRHPSVATIHE